MTGPSKNHIAYVKGDKLYKEGCFKEAAEFFRAASEEWPEDYMAFWALGNCYTELGKPRKAEKSFREALELCCNEDRVSLAFNLGNALFDQKRYSEALVLYSDIPSGHMLSHAARRNAFLAQDRLKE